jgi:uncharacterized protein YqhQ
MSDLKLPTYGGQALIEGVLMAVRMWLPLPCAPRSANCGAIEKLGPSTQ